MAGSTVASCSTLLLIRPMLVERLSSAVPARLTAELLAHVGQRESEPLPRPLAARSFTEGVCR